MNMTFSILIKYTTDKSKFIFNILFKEIYRYENNKSYEENFKNEMESIKTFLLIVNSIAISNPGKGSDSNF